MTSEDIDVESTAARLVQQHGTEATTVAMMKADELQEAGDFYGELTWRWIFRAIRELLNNKPPLDGAEIH